MGGTTAEQEKTSQIPVIDYEGSDYRHAFWEGQGRDYEDAVERVALRQLLPRSGDRIAEIGAGFGRLADLYVGYNQIVLFDYSRSMLADAVARWGHDERFVFVAGNLYELPLASGILDTLVMPRVMHHLADVPAALAQIERILHGQSRAILEYANKRNLKAVVRWLFRRQSWSPFAPEPVEFVRLNFDFHPRWMADRMEEAGLVRERQAAISHFRLPILKRIVPAEVLVRLEQPFFRLAGLFPFAPSVLVVVHARESRARHLASTDPLAIVDLFRCPHCTTEGLKQVDQDWISCPGCNRRYQRKHKIWDFKEPAQ